MSLYDQGAGLLFLLAAIGLLGSPGPGIAALLAVGRAEGLIGGLRFYAGLQLGLALAAAVSAAGLASVVALSPGLRLALDALASAYLLYLAWKIGSAPVGANQPVKAASGVTAGALLGITNPKAYVAFVSLIASRPLAAGGPAADAALKWAIIVAVIVAVDFAWLAFGALLGRARLTPPAERALNVLLALAIVAATVLEWSSPRR